MTLSISGQQLLQDVRLLRAIASAKPHVYGTSAEDYVHLSSEVLPSFPKLRTALETVVEHFGSLLGMKQNRNAVVRRAGPSAYQAVPRRGSDSSPRRAR
ncbi:hypothetical protein JCM11491_002181 [Sporobolomyces phaffii]